MTDNAPSPVPAIIPQIGWGVFAIRLVISLVSTAAVAFGISHYVVTQRTASIDTALQSVNTTLGTSLETINTTLSGIQTVGLDTNTKADAIAEKVSGLQTDIALSKQNIARLQAELASTQANLSRTGDEIKTKLDVPTPGLAKEMAEAFGKALVEVSNDGSLQWSVSNGTSTPPVVLQLNPDWYSLYFRDGE